MAKIIELSGEVGWEITAKGLENKLPKNGKHAILKIDSYGGSVFEGNRLFNTIKEHLNKFPNSISVELGVIAASAASYFPLAVGAENISVNDNTVFMIHKAWIIAMGNSDEMQLKVDILNGLDKMIAKIYSGITGKSIDDTLVDMKNEVWLMGGQDIIDAGFASKIIETGTSESDTENEPLEKNEISARMEEIKNKLKDIDNKEDLNKWAAKIIEVPENKTESKPPLGDGNINKEDISDMKLEEYLNKTPEAKAEYDTAVKNAVADGIKNERARGKEILNLATGDVSESVMNAYDTGMTAGEYAVNELKVNKEARNATPAQNLGTIDVTNQVPTGENSKEAINAATEKSVDDFLAKEGK